MRGIEQSNGLRVLCHLIDDLPAELQPVVAEDMAGILVNQSQIEDFEADEVFGVLEHAKFHSSTRRIVGCFIEDLGEPSDQRSLGILGATLAHHRLVQRTDHLDDVQVWLNRWLSGEDSRQVSQDLGEFLGKEFTNWQDDQEVLLTFFTTSYLDYVTGCLVGRFEDMPEVMPDDETGQQLVNALHLLAPLACNQDPARFWQRMEDLLTSGESEVVNLGLEEVEYHLERLSEEYVGGLADTLLEVIEDTESLEDSETWIDRIYGLLLSVYRCGPKSFTRETGSRLTSVIKYHVDGSQPTLVEVGLRYLVRFADALEPDWLRQLLDTMVARMAAFPTNAGEAMRYLDAFLAVDSLLSDDWRSKVVNGIDPWVRSANVNQMQTAQRLLERLTSYENYHSILRVRVDNWIGLVAPSLTSPRLENLVSIFVACDVVMNDEQATYLATALTQILRVQPGQAPLHPPIIAGLDQFTRRLSPEVATETTNILLDRHNNLSSELRWSALGILSELYEHISEGRRSQYAAFVHQHLSQRPEESLDYVVQAWSDWDNAKRVEAFEILYGALLDEGRSKLEANLSSLLSTLDQDSRLAVIYDGVLKLAGSPSPLEFFLDDAIPQLGHPEIQPLRERFLTLLREESAGPRGQAAMDFLARTSNMVTDDAEVIRCLIVLYERGEPEVVLAARNTNTVLADAKFTSGQKSDLAKVMASALKRVTNEPAKEIVRAIEEIGFLDRWSRQQRYFKEFEDLIENLRDGAD